MIRLRVRKPEAYTASAFREPDGDTAPERVYERAGGSRLPNGINQFDLCCRTGFFRKKAQTTPPLEYMVFLDIEIYTTSQLPEASLHSHISIDIKAFLNGWTASAVHSELCCGYAAHPPSPSFIVSSRSYRDSVPRTVLHQLSQKTCFFFF